jgi:hypothetical protein
MATLQRTWRALCRRGTLGLTALVGIATGVLFFHATHLGPRFIAGDRSLARGLRSRCGIVLGNQLRSTLAPDDEKFYRILDCHIAYSVRNVERTKTIGDTRCRWRVLCDRGALAF